MEQNSTTKKIKVLYISHHKEESGWGRVARDYILALDRVGIDVVPKAILLGKPNANIPNRIKKLENNNVEDCNICIQHVLPHYMKYDGRFNKNIGIFETETFSISHTPWIENLKLMDELWVPCTQMQQEVQSFISKPIRLIPHTFDISTYTKEYSKIDLPIKDKFVFYFIGEFNKRKHLSALIKAFHTEFSRDEPVELLLKLNKFGMHENQLSNEIKNFCNKIKDGLKLYNDISRYKPEIMITVHISDNDILRLHNSCDCFVCPSYGEAWCIPAWEAMAMGNFVIASGVGGMKDYIDSERNGFLVGGSVEPVFGETETFVGFGTAREKWFEISVSSLMKTMRRVYNLSSDKKHKISMEAKSSAKKYDYEIIGKMMKEYLYV